MPEPWEPLPLPPEEPTSPSDHSGPLLSPVVAPAVNPPTPIPTVEPVRRGSAILAWPVILAVSAFLVLAPLLLERQSEDNRQIDRISGILLQFQTRYALGAASLFKSANLGEALYDQLREIGRGSVVQRLRFAVIAGEMQNWEQALEELRVLEAEAAKYNYDFSAEEKRLIGILRSLFTDYKDGKMDAPSVSPEDRAKLREALGWFADLALTPKGGPDPQARKGLLAGAQRTFVSIIVAVVVGALMGFAGAAGLMVLTILYLVGWLRGGLRTGAYHHAVYAETFALYMVLFVALQLMVGFLPIPKEVELLALGMAMLASLVVLGWPVIRGIPWQVVRRDIGLTWGRRPWAEPFIGAGCYAMGLPMLVVGVIMTFVLMALQQVIEMHLHGPKEPNPFDPSLSAPAHPILEYLSSGAWWARLQVLFVAAVCAPIVEEIMFRGVFYRHVREATRGLGAVLSFLFSGFVVSFIFAVIHPQGWVATPALMALAFGFTIAREWRDTVVPGIVAHAINNGALMVLVMLATSG